MTFENVPSSRQINIKEPSDLMQFPIHFLQNTSKHFFYTSNNNNKNQMKVIIKTFYLFYIFNDIYTRNNDTELK